MRCGYCKTPLIEEVIDHKKRALIVFCCPKCGQNYYYERI